MLIHKHEPSKNNVWKGVKNAQPPNPKYKKWRKFEEDWRMKKKQKQNKNKLDGIWRIPEDVLESLCRRDVHHKRSLLSENIRIGIDRLDGAHFKVISAKINFKI